MYLLDTNVVSELRKAPDGKADKNVVAWAVALPVENLFLSVMTILELEQGTLLVERRDQIQGRVLREWLENFVIPSFEGRLLPVDVAVARRCAGLHVPDPAAERDALIAATALVHDLTVATRNVTDFPAAGLRVVNPWRP
jgi:toxin FitB